MRWSQTFIPTLKETPAEAEITSHKLLLRAGLARRLAGGLYTFLPLGLRVLHKIKAIIRDEMNRAGALEIAMPCLQPPEIWQKSGRYTDMSEVLYHVYDRSKKEWLLGPTHEENITVLVASEINSYRQLPKNFYQITVKFRDEIRPRFGLMRAREFIMKDAYSFDVDDRGADISYQKMYEAYNRIFARCGLRTIAVEAHTGAIGGSFSHEFMVPAESGENEIVFCQSCKYAANIEKAISVGPQVPTPKTSTAPAPEKFPTPGALTIEALAQSPFNVPAHHQIKTLVYIVENQPVIVLIRGDDQLNEAKLATALGTMTFRPATPDEIYAVLGAHPGSLGAVGVTTLPVYADESLRGGAGMVTGANEDGYHLRHVEIGRDIKVQRWFDLRTVKEGEFCAISGDPLKTSRAIEVGHIFKLGTKYSAKLGALFLDEHGKPQPAVMGCYGIGVTRTLQAIIEQCNDKDGIIWPISVAPYTVCITPLDVTPTGQIMTLAEQMYLQLQDRGVDVILDDRDERPGVKFKDSELVGFPIRIAIGGKSLAKNQVEIKPRAGELMLVSKDEAVARVLELLNCPSWQLRT